MSRLTADSAPRMRAGASQQRARTRETSVAKAWLKAIGMTSRIGAEPKRLFADVVEEWATLQPDHPALLSDTLSLSYRELAARSNRYARWAIGVGLGPGSVVCLLMPNRPDYIACWLGITRSGATVALLNPRLVGPSLAHCIEVARADHIILAPECAEALTTARPGLSRTPRIWSFGAAEAADDLEQALSKQDPRRLTEAERPAVTTDDRALLVFTSGSTGLPKAANVSHRRILSWAGWFAGLTEASTNDRIYDCLPLCHSVGGIVAPCGLLRVGGSVVVAEQFSAAGFWEDVIRFECTLFQYIGELCRYLLREPTPAVTHGLRLAIGNGLRGDIWELFAERFSIPRILEFYTATEGNFSLFNVEGKPGAVGRVPPLLAHRFPAAIVKIERETGGLLRDRNGFCVACEVDEVGHAIGRIGTPDGGGGAFEGYTDKDETERKIMRNVFAEGDAWFATGDLMSRDVQGYFRFVDRIGDTFRWKGENVAASEVNDAVRDCPGVVDAATYGVNVPGADGRAGMSAVVVDRGFDPAALAVHLRGRLPTYAHPVFIRICHSLGAAATFKQTNQRLIQEGFNIASDDPLFLRDPAHGGYRRVDLEIRARITAGEIRL